VKIVQTKKFVLSRSNSSKGDYQTQPGLNRPEDINGPMELFREKSDSEYDIKDRWRKKKQPKIKIKRPYQLDGVPGSIT